MKKALTLSEILISLTIIGIIAAITIPTLLQKYTDHVTVVKLKEAQSILSSATKKAIAEYGDMDTWWDTSITNGYNNAVHRDFGLKIISQLKTLPDCGTTDTGCSIYTKATERSYKNMNNTIRGIYSPSRYGGAYKLAVLQNGFFMWFTNMGLKNYAGELCDGYTAFSPRSYVTNICGVVYVDIDGYNKGPNIYGLDTFAFFIKKDGSIIPFGLYDTANSDDMAYATACAINSNRPEYCTVWVIKKGNMDYKYKTVDLTPLKVPFLFSKWGVIR